MAVPSKLHKLAELAHEKSSERRRELLREVTDLFFDAPPAPSSAAQQQFDDVLQTLASQTAQEAREELAERFADAPFAPKGLILQLARDAIEVAGPVLTRSVALDEEELVTIVHESGQDHIRAIAERVSVSERLSHAIVERGDDDAVVTLIENDGAQLSRETFESVTRRAETSEKLQAPLVDRADTPADLLNDLMNVVGDALRERLMERFDALEPGVLEAALAASQRRLQARLEEDQEITAARRYIASKSVRKELDGGLLVRLLREKKRTHFCVGFAELTGVDYATSKRALDEESPDGLALICKATGMEKALFVTIAVLRGSSTGNAMADAREIGEIYDNLAIEAAERTMRFFRMRRDAAA